MPGACLDGLDISQDAVRRLPVEIADEYQKQGLGTELLNRLIEIGRREGVKVIVADILAENTAMQKVAEKAGFKLARELGDPVVSARLEL